MAIPHISRRYRAQAVRAVSLSSRGERMTMDASMDQSRGKAKGKGRRVVMQFGYGRGHSLSRHPGSSWRLSLSHPQSRHRSEEHTSELQSLMRRSYAVFCLKKKKNNQKD